MSLWQDPLQSPQGIDYRNLKGYIYIDSEEGPKFFGQDRIGSLGDIENRGGRFLDCYESEPVIPIRLGNVPGIFYHGPRQKWVVWEGSSVSSTRVVDKETGEVKDTKNGPNTLGLRFDPTQLCVLNPDQLICSKVIVFEDGNACIPWPEEHIDLIDFKKIKHCTSEYSKNDGTVRGTIPLLGGIEYKYQITSNGIVFVDGTIQLWPFLPHWKSYWLRLSVQDKGLAVSKNWLMKPYKSTLEQNQRAAYLVSKPNFINRNTYVNKFESTQIISEWPDCIFLYKKNTSHVGGLLIVPGFVQENYLDGQNAGQTSRIALDFGTFRSVIAVCDPGIKKSFQFMLDNDVSKNNHSNFVNDAQIPGFASLTCIVASNGQKNMERWHIACPDYKASISNVNIQKNKEIKFLTTFSKIIFSADETEGSSSQNIPASDRIPFLDFTLPFDFEQEFESKSLSASKWNLFSRENAIKPFLKALFLMAMVEQQGQSPRESAIYNISYPLAFSNKQREFLIKVCYEAVQWVNQCLPEGVMLRGSNEGYPRAYSESQAIYKAAGANNNLKNKIIGVADIGGGTLDISVWKIEQGKDSGEPIIIDSVQIGAEYVYSRYLSLINDGGRLTKWKLIKEGYEKLAEPIENHDECKSNLIPTANQWLDAQIEYIARTFGCAIPKNNSDCEVVLVLAGGGWKVAELFRWNIKNLKEKIYQKLKKQLLDLGVQIQNFEILTDLYKNGFEKIAVAGGLLEIGSDQMAIDEIRSPNGLEEETEVGSPNVSWNTMIHEQDPWPGLKIVQDGDQVRPRLHFQNSIEKDILRRVEGKLRDEIKDQKRTKTALAALLEYYFSPREENQ
jgi:hypothetical protein